MVFLNKKVHSEEFGMTAVVGTWILSMTNLLLLHFVYQIFTCMFEFVWDPLPLRHLFSVIPGGPVTARKRMLLNKTLSHGERHQKKNCFQILLCFQGLLLLAGYVDWMTKLKRRIDSFVFSECAWYHWDTSAVVQSRLVFQLWFCPSLSPCAVFSSQHSGDTSSNPVFSLLVHQWWQGQNLSCSELTDSTKSLLTALTN